MAKRFVFKLSPVLEQRQRAEDERRRAVAELERQRVALEDRLRGLQVAIDEAKAEQRAMLAGVSGGGGVNGAAGAVAVSSVRMQAGSWMAITAKAHQTALELAGVLRRLESARGDLLRAAADRKAVEMLRERQLEAWRAEQNRREIAELDDIAQSRAAREGVQA